MSKAAASCDIVTDSGGLIADWVCKGLGENIDWIGDNLTIGIVSDGKLLAGIIFNNYRPQTDVTLTIYTTNKRWCSKKILKHIFGIAFETLNVRRISLLVSVSNEECLRLVDRLGFKREGLLRQYRENGEDCYFLGMLKNECKWR